MVVKAGSSDRALLILFVTSVAARQLDVDESTMLLSIVQNGTLGFGTCRLLN